MQGRGAIASFFMALQAIFNLIIGLGKQADRGVAMVDTFMADAQYTQSKRSKADRKDYVSRYARELADRKALEEKKIREKCEADPTYSEDFKAAYSEYMELLADDDESKS